MSKILFFRGRGVEILEKKDSHKIFQSMGGGGGGVAKK